MRVLFFPVVRLADDLSRHGYRVWLYVHNDDIFPDPAEFFVLRQGRVLAQITRGWARRAVTVIYETRDPELLTIARRYGEVWADANRSPQLPVGARDVTGKSVASSIRAGAVALLILVLFFLAAWFQK
jgi:hypothetical protein